MDLQLRILMKSSEDELFDGKTLHVRYCHCCAGMLCAETAAMVWILLATYLEMPVSTTHSISKFYLA